MRRRYGSFYILKVERCLGRYAMLGEVVVEGAAKESAVDEEVEWNRLLIVENRVHKA